MRTDLIKNFRKKVQTKEFEFEFCENGKIAQLKIEEHEFEFVVGIYSRGVDVHAGMRGILACRLMAYYKTEEIITTSKTLTSWEITTAINQTRVFAGEIFDTIVNGYLSKND